MSQEALEKSSPTSRKINSNRTGNGAGQTESEPKQSTTLIEFPGTSRSVPAWRKQLSQRVREVQERKAREAAEELAAAQAAGAVSCALPSGQLELVPDVDQPVMNPIVTKALERVERARRYEPIVNRSGGAGLAVAPALKVEPSTEVSEPEFVRAAKTKLTVVASRLPLLDPTPEIDSQHAQRKPTKRRPVRVISDDDAALSYLETCLSVPALEADTRRDLPGFPRRIIAGVFDLVLIGLMVSPVVAAINYTGGDWFDARVLGVMSGITAITMFAYLTISVALTGKTLAMRMFSLRAIDLRTGLIPTGGQSIKRAVVQIVSLAFFGLGLIYAFIDPDGRTVHDRLSKTIVVRG